MKTYHVELLVGLDPTKEESKRINADYLKEGIEMTKEADNYNIETVRERLDCQVTELGDNWYEVIIDDVQKFLDWVNACEYDYSDVVEINQGYKDAIEEEIRAGI